MAAIGDVYMVNSNRPKTEPCGDTSGNGSGSRPMVT